MTSGIGRIPIVAIEPSVDGGRFPAKAVVGERVNVRVTSFREGHDAMGVQLIVADPTGRVVERSSMRSINPGLDLWEGSFRPLSEGAWSFRVEAYDAPYDTWVHTAEVKIGAGIDEDLVCAEGIAIMERLLDQIADGERPTSDRARVAAAKDALGNHSLAPSARIAPALSLDMRTALDERPLKGFSTLSDPAEVWVERARALAGSWYEFFPRSEGARFDPEAGGWISGTLRSSLPQLERIKRMGFDVAYLTPIHPIGTTFRKGRNNTLEALPGDPGSPYAIGSADGGHDAIHPDLGTMADFDAFVARAHELDLEVAMDIALQCSPDHPWVSDHPEWFNVRADGSIAFAENPPKKYQDIYPLSFDHDYEGLYVALRDMLEMWVDHGVTLFRVDNPHTKPVRFWEELLAEFRVKHPQVLFLAEAFTKPAMMHTLAKVGFHQSYTYYTWRHSAEELREYMEELKAAAHYMRPSFWPTTHDILTPFMSEGGWNAFRLRAILAATLSPTWGIYSGYELVEDVPRPGAQENIDNEKYEYTPRDYDGALRSGRSLEPLLTRLNTIRAEHPALQSLRALRFHGSDDDRVLVFSKHIEGRDTDSGLDDTIIVVSMTEARGDVSTWIHLDLGALNIHSDFMVEDLLTGESFLWDRDNFVSLNADHRPAHVLRVVRY
ncbi:MAG: alpha-1,4-glucan--maltose-1-phosphate maltosyltransferase [Dermabacter sp.]|nr:alpha-1,4-glucan--maltose-1-phosphate maltosyltransferase [Dermabacter sp.]